jgi:hypothetical protein
MTEINTEEVKTQKKQWKDYNKWLEDSEFIYNTNFEDKYYLESLCHHLSNFIKNVPIPVLCDYSTRYKSIYFSVGDDKNNFPLTIDISYYDYITLVKRWLYQFFPRYEVLIDAELDDDEILKLVREQGYNLNDALLERKKVPEIGVIEKEIRKEDQFIININGTKTVRITGNKKPLLLKDFMKELRGIKDQQQRKNYILDNSREFSTVVTYDKVVRINYQNSQLLNFFKVNYEDLKDYELKESEPFVYEWKNYLIRFSSITLRNDCLKYYQEMKEKK